MIRIATGQDSGAPSPVPESHTASALYRAPVVSTLTGPGVFIYAIDPGGVVSGAYSDAFGVRGYVFAKGQFRLMSDSTAFLVSTLGGEPYNAAKAVPDAVTWIMMLLGLQTTSVART